MKREYGDQLMSKHCLVSGRWSIITYVREDWVRKTLALGIDSWIDFRKELWSKARREWHDRVEAYFDQSAISDLYPRHKPALPRLSVTNLTFVEKKEVRKDA